MSERLQAWYVLLALGFLTLLLLSFLGRPPASLSSAVALPQRLVYTASANLRGFLAGGRERRVLLAEVTRLDRELASAQTRIRALELGNARYAEVLDLRATQSPGVMMSAPVISAPLSAVGGTLELGLGRAAGVEPDMPVTAPAGLVGVVTDVSPRTAWVRTVLDPASAVGVSVRGRGGQGLARGEVGGLVRVTGYTEQRPVRVGDLVETSSRGGLFPRGLLLGRVTQVLPKGTNTLRREFLVRPGADVGNLLEVALIRPL